MNTPILSIIIPAYNAASSIERCMASVLKQRGMEYSEIIVVNDGSTDKTPDILANIATHTPNLTVINQPNMGVSGARNTGIEKSHGKYITFIDSDDIVGINARAINYYARRGKLSRSSTIGNMSIRQSRFINMPDIHLDFRDDYFTNMLDAAHNCDADVAMAGKITINTGAKYIKSHMYDTAHTFGTNASDKDIVLKQADCRENANFALYRRELLDKHNLWFIRDMQLDEDILFCMTATLHASYVATVPDTAYLYMRHSNSLSNFSDVTKSNAKYSIANVQRFSVLLNEIVKYPEYGKIFTHWLREFSYNAPHATDAFDAYPSAACVQCPFSTCDKCMRYDALLEKFQENIRTYIPATCTHMR